MLIALVSASEHSRRIIDRRDEPSMLYSSSYPDWEIELQQGTDGPGVTEMICAQHELCLELFHALR
jgi:hypothetical protein